MNYTHCGARETMGHGDSAACGEPYYGDMWQCRRCATKDVQRLREALEEIASSDMTAKGYQMLANAALDDRAKP